MKINPQFLSRNTAMAYYVSPKRWTTEDELKQWAPRDDKIYTHQKHPHCSVWKPRIPLHQYLDTEYSNILNSPPALCSGNGITKRRSSYHTIVLQTNSTKTYIHGIIPIIPTQNSESHIPSRNQISVLNFEKNTIICKSQIQKSNWDQLQHLPSS